MKRIIFCLMLQAIILFQARAQPYIEGGITRHRFAQLNLGIDQRYFSGANTVTSNFNLSGGIENARLPDHFETRLIIGGTHFWGRADFFIAIPVFSSNKSGFNTSVETGLKVFPWRIKNKTLRPFLGAS